MSYQHKELAAGRWFRLTFFEQMANVGSDVGRAITWKNKNDGYRLKSMERAFELLDLTIADARNRKRLRELTRLRETLVDYFYFDNQYSSSDRLWQNYFYAFSYAARRNKGNVKA